MAPWVDDLSGGADGLLRFGVIPSGKNTEAASGTSADVVGSVPRCEEVGFGQPGFELPIPLEGFETDVAVTPRRSAGIVLWVGQTGRRNKKDGSAFGGTATMGRVTFKVTLSCSGTGTQWH